MGPTGSENGRDQGDDGSDQSSSTIEKALHHRSTSIIRRQSPIKKKKYRLRGRSSETAKAHRG
eukprot:TRINITY_DN3459_c0_g1_i1.p1 TRINITY_DN3459_c0_g1~~TRINITY_DN3459_c0_g1_i1.p1  ORF type:complete len:63 (+),score=26.91 TRINITY_DN3459_c0_g1_i1:112-300(+)